MDYLTPDFLNGLGTVGLCVLILASLIMGKGLALQREVKNRDQTIVWQRSTILELSEQIKELIIGTGVAAGALDKVANAAVEAGHQE